MIWGDIFCLLTNGKKEFADRGSLIMKRACLSLISNKTMRCEFVETKTPEAFFVL